jgi:hypothetical protein
MGGGIGSETVKQTVAVCLQIGLFDKRLFDLGGVLTSKGIQRRFAQAIQSRRCKTADKEFWLLGEAETRSYGIVLENSDLLPTNGDLQEANAYLQEANDPNSKVKESKVKDSKGKESSSASKTRKPTPDQLISEQCFPPDLEAAVKDWVQYKIEKQQGYKETGLKNLLTQIKRNTEKYGEQKVTLLIRECMSNNWQGIIWDRFRTNKPDPKKNRFNNFHQRDYDFDEMEKKLLNS